MKGFVALLCGLAIVALAVAAVTFGASAVHAAGPGFVIPDVGPAPAPAGFVIPGDKQPTLNPKSVVESAADIVASYRRVLPQKSDDTLCGPDGCSSASQKSVSSTRFRGGGLFPRLRAARQQR